MAEQISLRATIPDTLGGKRLDQVAAQLFPDYSRSRLQAWIKAGQLRVDGQAAEVRAKVFGGQELAVTVEEQNQEQYEPCDIALDVVYEDAAIMVINKPAGLVVHPAAGHYDDTLLNGLLFRNPELAHLPRAGIVHRLDKDTSGLMVVAKTLAAQTDLVEQLQARTVSREYEAVAIGVLISGGTIESPIGRHPTQRIKMAVTATGKEAITHYRILERFRGHTHVAVKLETGRTHQIRVHLDSIGHPLAGDPVYGGRLRYPAGASPELRALLKAFPRQALHARRLGLIHPETRRPMEWEAPLPEDFLQLLAALEEDNG